jgi:hypothetical protein
MFMAPLLRDSQRANGLKVKVTLRLTVSQSVNLGFEPHLGLMTRYLLLSWQLRFCFLWGALSDERPGLSFICCWPLPAQSFLGPSPWELATILYCLRIEISLFVTSYDWQGHGEGIRPRLHTGFYFLRSLNLAAFKVATVQVTRLPL